MSSASVTGTAPFMTSKLDPPSPFSPPAHQWKINGCLRKLSEESYFSTFQEKKKKSSLRDLNSNCRL